MVMQIRRNFQITLPAAIRKRLGLSIGDILETTLKEGKIIIIPKKAIDADQAWFWQKDWQNGEKAAEEDLKAGKVKKFNTVKDLIKELDK